MKPIFFQLMLAVCCFSLAAGQENVLPQSGLKTPLDSARKVDSKRDKDAREFVESVMERNMDQLFEAISLRDKNSFNVAFSAGMTGGPVGRRNVVFVQILSDFRVTKLRELLTEMSKEDAASRVKEEFDKKFAGFKKGFHGWFDPLRDNWNAESFDPDPAAHGLAALLYLSSEFCDHFVFVGQYRRWLEWYRIEALRRFTELEELRNKLNQGLISAEDFSKKMGLVGYFKRSGTPDRLYFINLCAIRAVRRGVEIDTLKEWIDELNEELHVQLPEIVLMETNRFDPATNLARKEKIKFPLIFGYGEAWRLDDRLEWDALKSERITQIRKINDRAVSIAINWSRPNVIGTWVRRVQKSFEESYSGALAWLNPNKH